jgi:hypothetical protein
MRLLRVLGYGAGLGLLLVAGCGQGVRKTPGESTPASFGADDLVVRVGYTGGFTTPEDMLTRLPIVSVYGDGRVLTEAPVLAIYPGPSLPKLQLRRTTPADVRQLLNQAIAAGAADGGDFGTPGVADAANTKFSVLTAAGPRSTEVYALSEGREADQSHLTQAQRDARNRLSTFFETLTKFPGTLGDPEEYQPKQLLAVAHPWTDQGSTDLPTPPEVAWPGPALPGEPLELEHSCVSVTGQQLTDVVASTLRANAATPWTHGGKRWTITFRPLLPDESGCVTVRGTQPTGSPTPS